MDKDRIAGAARQVRGSVKEALGKITGNKKARAEGMTDKAAGKAQNTAGSVKDTVRDTVKK